MYLGRLVELAPKGRKQGTVRVGRGKKAMVDAIVPTVFGVSVAKGEQGKVKTEVRLRTRVEAPVPAGMPVGEIVATMDGKELGRVDLVAAEAVPKATVVQMMILQVGRVFSLR